MAALDVIPIYFYFGGRLFLQAYNGKGSIAINTVRKYRIAFSMILLLLESWIYLMGTISYNAYIAEHPDSWMIGPLPVPFFLLWLVILVSDTFLQLLLLYRLPKKDSL